MYSTDCRTTRRLELPVPSTPTESMVLVAENVDGVGPHSDDR